MQQHNKKVGDNKYMSDIIIEDDEKDFKDLNVVEKDQLFNLRFSKEDYQLLAELAAHLKNSKSGAAKYAIKYCHRIFVKEKAS